MTKRLLALLSVLVIASMALTACGGAAGYLQELHFAGDQSVHAFNAGWRGDHFHVQAMFVEDPSFARDPGWTHR